MVATFFRSEAGAVQLVLAVEAGLMAGTVLFLTTVPWLAASQMIVLNQAVLASGLNQAIIAQRSVSSVIEGSGRCSQSVCPTGEAEIICDLAAPEAAQMTR